MRREKREKNIPIFQAFLRNNHITSTSQIHKINNILFLSFPFYKKHLGAERLRKAKFDFMRVTPSLPIIHI